MAQTIRTIFCLCASSAAVPTIKITICIIGFIIAVSIANQIKWSCTVQNIADTIITIIFVDIRSTTIISIIVAFCSICIIITIVVIYIARDFTALKIKIESILFLIILWKKSITHSPWYLPLSKNKKVPVKLCLWYFLPSIRIQSSIESWHQVHNSHHHQSHNQHYSMNLDRNQFQYIEE